MHQPVVIRRANPTLTDATLLQAVEHDSLGDSDYTAQEMLAVLCRPEQMIYLACDGAATDPMPRSIGFCACIVTPLDDTGQHTCLEIDMLGVRPSYRGQGVATRLIERAAQDARAQGYWALRAVIEQDNGASQRAFERAGLHRVEPLRHMLVFESMPRIQGTHPPSGWRWRPALAPDVQIGQQHSAVAELHWIETEAGRSLASARCLVVHTLSYSGIWIESLQSESGAACQALAGALAERVRMLDLQEVGYLAPVTDQVTEALLAREGYRSVGSYWIYGAEISSIPGAI